MACLFLDPTRVITQATRCFCTRCQVLCERHEESQRSGIEPPRQYLSPLAYDMLDKELGVGTWERH